jgi:hypothetical protein
MAAPAPRWKRLQASRRERAALRRALMRGRRAVLRWKGAIDRLHPGSAQSARRLVRIPGLENYGGLVFNKKAFSPQK